MRQHALSPASHCLDSGAGRLQSWKYLLTISQEWLLTSTYYYSKKVLWPEKILEGNHIFLLVFQLFDGGTCLRLSYDYWPPQSRRWLSWPKTNFALSRQPSAVTLFEGGLMDLLELQRILDLVFMDYMSQVCEMSFFCLRCLWRLNHGGLVLIISIVSFKVAIICKAFEIKRGQRVGIYRSL